MDKYKGAGAARAAATTESDFARGGPGEGTALAACGAGRATDGEDGSDGGRDPFDGWQIRPLGTDAAKRKRGENIKNEKDEKESTQVLKASTQAVQDLACVAHDRNDL